MIYTGPHVRSIGYLRCPVCRRARWTCWVTAPSEICRPCTLPKLWVGGGTLMSWFVIAPAGCRNATNRPSGALTCVRAPTCENTASGRKWSDHLPRHQIPVASAQARCVLPGSLACVRAPCCQSQEHPRKLQAPCRVAQRCLTWMWSRAGTIKDSVPLGLTSMGSGARRNASDGVNMPPVSSTYHGNPVRSAGQSARAELAQSPYTSRSQAISTDQLIYADRPSTLPTRGARGGGGAPRLVTPLPDPLRS